MLRLELCHGLGVRLRERRYGRGGRRDTQFVGEFTTLTAHRSVVAHQGGPHCPDLLRTALAAAKPAGFDVEGIGRIEDGDNGRVVEWFLVRRGRRRSASKEDKGAKEERHGCGSPLRGKRGAKAM